MEAPEIFVAAGDGASFLERVDYVLDEVPSNGEIFDEKDREYIRGARGGIFEGDGGVGGEKWLHHQAW